MPQRKVEVLGARYAVKGEDDDVDDAVGNTTQAFPDNGASIRSMDSNLSESDSRPHQRRNKRPKRQATGVAGLHKSTAHHRNEHRGENKSKSTQAAEMLQTGAEEKIARDVASCDSHAVETTARQGPRSAVAASEMHESGVQDLTVLPTPEAPAAEGSIRKDNLGLKFPRPCVIAEQVRVLSALELIRQARISAHAAFVSDIFVMPADEVSNATSVGAASVQVHLQVRNLVAGDWENSDHGDV